MSSALVTWICTWCIRPCSLKDDWSCLVQRLFSTDIYSFTHRPFDSENFNLTPTDPLIPKQKQKRNFDIKCSKEVGKIWTWKGVEEILRSGKAKAIGVSNVHHLKEFFANCKLRPYVRTIQDMCCVSVAKASQRFCVIELF